MANQLFQKIKFLLTSINHHGVHSPFVFDYLTKCLYQKKLHPQSKTVDVLFKSISYFGFQNLEIQGNQNLQKIVSKKFPETRFDRLPFDLSYSENMHEDLVSRLFSEGKIHNNSMLVINSIHKNKKSKEIWNHIIADKRATVTLDLFYCAAVFFRKEQVKEHFKIRI